MQGVVSFHPVDLGFYDDLVQPLIQGRKVNPETWLADALRMRIASWHAARYARVLEDLLEQLEPPPPPPDGTLWDKVRTRLERFDFRPPRAAVLAGRSVEPDLHLHGRPFLIAEGSAERVVPLVDEFRNATGVEELDALVLEQLIRLHPDLGRAIELDPDDAAPEPDARYRTALLKAMKEIFDIASAARAGETYGRFAGETRTGEEVLRTELPWRTLVLHSRAVPYWIARDVDGIETVCRAAGVEPPDLLVPAWRLFGEACEEFPYLRDALGIELRGEGQIGAFAAPGDVPELLEFLNAQGSRIIKVASAHGEGNACALLLRKVRECLRYAEAHGFGYLEAGGLPVLQT